ncbi:hypothetical protein V7101_20505, partial [Bacillus velezensis]|uniref:hypothetical protein n=1 Tax=Bacillus velezensis TaxID=492670 RepID=UPI003000963D
MEKYKGCVIMKLSYFIENIVPIIFSLVTLGFQIFGLFFRSSPINLSSPSVTFNVSNSYFPTNTMDYYLENKKTLSK